MYVGNVNRREGDQKNWWILKNVRLGFTCLTFFFFKEKSCMNEKKQQPLYTVSVKKKKTNGLFWFLASTPHELEFNVARVAIFKHLWSSSSFQSKHYHAAFWVPRTLSNRTLPWISPAAFLLKDQNQFDLGMRPSQWNWRCVLPVSFVDIACVFHLKP